MDTIRLPRDYREFFELLSAHDVRYLVVGAYAVIFHGHCRGTADIDVWVSPDRANAERLAAALDAFGFESADLSVDDLTELDTVIQLGYPPYRIDLLTSVSGVTFEEAYAHRVVVTSEESHLSVIGLEDLKASKRAAGRHKDLADLESLP